ncbi:SDR family NAD(P)-dependent oxidoreductase [Bacillus pumilus]|uniref:SDR family NAD(P)-dependent oxidoreductase n=1 Tax=Bacillus pumilus TaxID=1408 RepID=UPI0037045DBA
MNSVFLVTQRVGREMVKNGEGKVVNMGWVVWFEGGVFVRGYRGSKEGVGGVRKGFGNEWGNQHIEVNAIGAG